MNARRIGIGTRLHPALLRSDKEHMRPKLRPICRFRSIGHKGHIGLARHLSAAPQAAEEERYASSTAGGGRQGGGGGG